MRTSSHLTIVGWGRIPLPGEAARIERASRRAREALAPREDRDPPPGSDVPKPARRAETTLGERKLYLVPDGPLMAGADVSELQRRLVRLGYHETGPVDGVFGTATHQALVRFQNDYGIFTDGVCARVSVLVLNFLDSIGTSAENPATDKQKRLIYWSVSAQRSGMVLVGTTVRQTSEEHDAEPAILERLRTLVEESIERDAHMQALPTSSMLTPAERAQFANSIKAELIVLLDLRRVENGPAGIQTHYFSRAGADSDVGSPLAGYIGEEIARQTGAPYLGARAEDSELLMSPQAPAIGVTVGNVLDPDDLRRLGDTGYLKRVAQGVALGITRLYLLGARYAPEGSAPVNPLSRREAD
ncbi:peptidoglycan-binding protein [Amycolatopsis sp. NPDC005003]